MTTSLRIALFHNLPSGGAVRALHEHVRRLSARHEFHLFCFSSTLEDFQPIREYCASTTAEPFEPSQPTLRPYFLNALTKRKDLMRLDAAAAALARTIDAGDFDLVYAHHCRFVHAPLLLRHVKTPSVFYCQETLRKFTEAADGDGESDLYSRFRGRFWRIYDEPWKRMHAESVRAASVVLCNSQFSRVNIQHAYGVDPRVVYLGVDTDKFKRLELPREDFVLSVGALAALKGHDFVVRGLARLSPDCRPPLVIVADREDVSARVEIEKIAAISGVDLKIKVRVTDAELVELYNRARVVACAQVREPFGLIALEAMACGAVVVAVDEGGFRESVIHGETGVLIRRDEAAFAAAVKEMTADAAERERMSKNAESNVRGKWNWDDSAAKLEKEFFKIAGVKHKFRMRISTD